MKWFAAQSTRQGLAALALIVGLLLYQGLSLIESGPGFPLDDAWIHQTYARNLAATGAWEFRSGASSGGSTAPLWTVLISIGYLFGLEPSLWSTMLGLILLGITGVLGALWFSERNPDFQHWWLLVFMVIALEWHLLWAAFSGMETLAQTLVFLAVFYLLERDHPNFITLGLLTGLGVWLRPDALTLLLPIGLSIFLASKSSIQVFFRACLLFAAAFGLTVLPYLYFNVRIAGTIWPNTFFAKQAEYQILREAPFVNRWLEQMNRLLAGVLVVLVPGILYASYLAIRKRRWRRIIPLLWAAVFLGLYAFRLPVTYQHGRYAIPVLPVVLVLGLEGMLTWLDWNAPETINRVLSRVWLVTLVVVLLLFFFMGARVFSRDVSIIQSEMVTTAAWIQENTEQDALIAAHDIGALGYFADRDILDLAGLVSPEVIPFIREEVALAAYLDQQKADYLVTFPNWYPELSASSVLIYSTEAPFSLAAGGENMAVFRWRFAR